MGAFDHPKWSYDEAFEQLFGPRTEGFEPNIFKKFKCPRGRWGRGGGGGMLKLQFNQYITGKSFPASRDSLSSSRQEVQRGEDKTWARGPWTGFIVLPIQKVSQTFVKTNLRPN